MIISSRKRNLSETKETSLNEKEEIASKRRKITQKCPSNQIDHSSTIGSNLLSLFNELTVNDVTICVSNGSIQRDFEINRLLLAGISDVFKKMLFGNTIESRKDSTVYITDCDPICFVEIIKYSKGEKINLNSNNIISIKY